MFARTFWEVHFKLEQSAFPQCFVLAWHAAFPFLEIHNSVFALGFCVEAERVVTTPLLAVEIGQRKPDMRVRFSFRTVPLEVCSGRETWRRVESVRFAPPGPAIG